jgi:hypothetical protein
MTTETYCRCGASSGGKVYCADCTLVRAQQRKARAEKRAAQGICTQCKAPANVPHRMCKGCQEKTRVQSQVLGAARRAAGCCPECGGKPEPPYRYCVRCRQRVRQRTLIGSIQGILQPAAKRRNKRKAQGLCIHCGEAAPLEGLASCEKCLSDIRYKKKKNG